MKNRFIILIGLAVLCLLLFSLKPGWKQEVRQVLTTWLDPGKINTEYVESLGHRVGERGSGEGALAVWYGRTNESKTDILQKDATVPVPNLSQACRGICAYPKP